MAMQFDRKSIRFAQIEDPNLLTADQANAAQMNANAAAAGDTVSPTVTAPAGDSDFNKALQGRGLMSLQAMFEVTHDSSQARNPLGSRWAKQCYAFVHYCLYSTDSKTLQKPFLTFVLRTSKEPPTEALFKECFGMSYQEMLLQLRSYAGFTAYKYQDFRAKGEGLPEPEPLALRDATDAETGRIKGEALILAGHAETARNALIAPYVRGERDPQLLASLGLWERTANHDERARKFLEAAAKGKVVRPRAYLELARLRSTEAQAQPAGADGRFSASQTAAILQPLLIARTQPPATPEIYLLIVAALAKSETAPTPEQFAILNEGIRSFPHHAELIYRIADYCLQIGRPQPAAELIEIGLKISPNEKVTKLFELLKTELPATTPVPKSAPASKPVPARAK
jgi:tetratricopeptide (TPR) repeat protein